jgi:hypothetical protein
VGYLRLKKMGNAKAVAHQPAVVASLRHLLRPMVMRRIWKEQSLLTITLSEVEETGLSGKRWKRSELSRPTIITRRESHMHRGSMMEVSLTIWYLD